jgi:4-hydroxythreonine-4-phosphate dehydrogenase
MDPNREIQKIMPDSFIQKTCFPERPLIGITMGDPLGIGPEVLVKALHGHDLHRLCVPVVLGDPDILQTALSRFSIPLTLNRIDHPQQSRKEPGVLNLMAVSDLKLDMSTLSSMTSAIGKAMAGYIHRAVDLAMAGHIDAVVTAPITKTGLRMAGSSFHGHTELIAHQTGTQKFAMMLAGETLKVVLVTIHMPLARVPESLTPEKILETIRLTDTALKTRFNVPNPRLAMAGLNPHAGEDGLFGSEEQQLIIPAAQTARDQGIDIQGPLPPDTVFNHAIRTGCDAVVCMYHDQGLIPFKLIHFKDGVNITLGLPVIRTSVDHGTAYDIAWKGLADPASMVQAIRTAVFQARNRTDRTMAHA